MLPIIVAGLTALTLPTIYKWYKNSDIISNNTFKVIGTDNSLFYIDNNLSTIIEVENEYQYSDIRPTDIVMDIGACIGGFSLKVSDLVSKVYAIESVMTETLQNNINLNNKQNITIIEALLGNGLTKATWNNKTEYKFGLSLTELIDIAGGHIDFLKMDCEGAEHCILPEELSNIRRIEAEIHNFDQNGKSHDFNSFEKMLNSANFEYTKNITSRGQMMIHAKNTEIP